MVAGGAARRRSAGRAVRGAAAAPGEVRGPVHQRRAARVAGAQARRVAPARRLRPGGRRPRGAGDLPGGAQHRGPGAAGTGDGDHDRRRLAVDAGHRHRARPLPGHAGGGRAVRRRPARPDQPRPGLLRRDGDHPGHPHDRPRAGAHRAPQPAAGRGDRDRRGGVHLADHGDELPVDAADRRRGGAAGPGGAAVRRLQHGGPGDDPGGRGGRGRAGAGVHDRLRHRLRRAGPQRRALPGPGRPLDAGGHRRRDRRQLQRGGQRGRAEQVYEDLGSQIGYTTEAQDISPWFVRGGLLFAFLGIVASLLWTNRLL